MNPLLTTKQVAELLSCKRSTIYAWTKAGMIPHYKIGQLVRFKQEDIDKWLKESRKEARTQERRTFKYHGNTSNYSADEIIRKAIDESKGVKV